MDLETERKSDDEVEVPALDQSNDDSNPEDFDSDDSGGE